MYRSLFILFLVLPALQADEPCCPKTVVAEERFPTLVNPNCSHCVDEARRRGTELLSGDNVLCWIRGYSEGGAIPYRFFLHPFPVISDSYGSFVADPYAGFARAYGPWYHYRFYGWHGGVMLIKDTKDGTIYSALSGKALEGPKKGKRLKPIPSLVSTWGDWMQQYPQAVAYHLYPKYQPVDAKPIDETKARESRGKADDRLPEQTRVLGITVGEETRAYPVEEIHRQGFLEDQIAGTRFVIFWQATTGTAAAYRPLASPPRKYKAPAPNADGVSPAQVAPAGLPQDKALTIHHQPDPQFPLAPYVDAETQSRWDIAGRATHGELKGWTLEWVDSVMVKWFAWSMEYPATTIYGQAAKKAEAPSQQLNEKVKAIAGTAEFLKSVPKKMARLVQVESNARTVLLEIDSEAEKSNHLVPSIIKTWKLTSDAEIKRHGWWARLEQFQPGERVWVWFKTNRAGEPVAISMLMDELTMQDMHSDGLAVSSSEPHRIDLQISKGKVLTLPADVALKRGLHDALLTSLKKDEKVYYTSMGKRTLYDAAAFEEMRLAQKQWLRARWAREGLPGTITFTHIFNGELDIVLDHETMRWARALQPGTAVQLNMNNQSSINGMVKLVESQRERTLARLVVNGKDQAELNIGDRVLMKVPTPPASMDESPFPSDIDQKRTTREQRIEWFLANIYCTCGVDKDTCTGHVYTLACCNPNGCGMPNDMRKQLAKLIDEGKSDREIFEILLKRHGHLLVKPHLKP